MKNSFAPVNRIPPEVLSSIPDYYYDDGYDTDQELITLTHICHSWRDTFISRSSLWTKLDLTNVEKTHTYIQRSKSYPLKVYLERDEDNTCFDETFFLVTPHIHRIKSLTVYGDAPALDIAFLNGDLSSLCELSLSRVITHLPWKNLANLTTFILKSCRPRRDFVTRLLDFFENAPLLHTIMLEDSIPDLSNAPPGRVVPLPRLDRLTIKRGPARPILLNHLCIPIGVSLDLRFIFNSEGSTFQECLPETFANLRNLSHITTINLHFDTRQSVRMNGPSGELYVYALNGSTPTFAMDSRLLHSLDSSILLMTHRLAVSMYDHPGLAEVEKCPVFHTLSSMDSLRTLVLNKCHNLPFILALNPKENSSKLVACPNLEKLIVYIHFHYQFHAESLVSMAKERALRDAKLSLVRIVYPGKFMLEKEWLGLCEYVMHAEWRSEHTAPLWDDLPGESSDESE